MVASEAHRGNRIDTLSDSVLKGKPLKEGLDTLTCLSRLSLEGGTVTMAKNTPGSDIPRGYGDASGSTLLGGLPRRQVQGQPGAPGSVQPGSEDDFGIDSAAARVDSPRGKRTA